ncbi:MAG: phage tail length tape measure family protein [Pseudomonadota bacterium]
MADESIVIEIKDTVDVGITAKINGIASSARAAQTAIDGVQKSISGLNPGNINSIAAGIFKAEIANEKLAAAQQKTAAAAAIAEREQAKTAATTALTSAAQDKAALSALRLSEAHQKVTDKLAAQAATAAAAVQAQSALDEAAKRGAQIEADYAAMLAKQAAEMQQNTNATTANAAAQSKLNSVNNSVSASAMAAGKSVKVEADEVANLLGKIDPVVGALGRLDEQEKKLSQFKKIGAIDNDTFTQYKAKLDQSRQSLGQFDDSTKKAGFSAAQLRQSMLYLPAQFGDLARSIASGQSPILAIFQQGSQLTNMFGSLGGAIKAAGGFLLGLITPFTVVGAALGIFLYLVGKTEFALRELNALSAQFSASGRGDIDNSFIVQLRKELALLPGVSKAAATSIIQEFANIRDIGSSTLKQATLVVADLGTALGITAPEAAKKLASALYDPLKGAQDLDKALGFLTIKDFKTLKSLDELGKTAQAQTFLIGKLKNAIDGLAIDTLTPMQKASNDLGNSWSKFTGELSNTGPIKAANDLFVGLLESLTAILNRLSNYKAPAWLENMARGGLNGWVADLFKGNAPATGGATGSWEAPKGLQYQQTTKFKTDAAGITGSKFKDEIDAQIEALKGAQALKEQIAKQTVAKVTSEYNRGMLTELDYINQVATAEKTALAAGIITAQWELSLARSKFNNKKEIASLSSKVAEAQEKYNARELQQGYAIAEMEFKVNAEKTKFYNEADKRLIDEIAGLTDKNRVSTLELESLGLTQSALANLNKSRADEVISLQEEKIAVLQLMDASNQNLATIQLETDKLNALKIARDTAYSKDVYNKEKTGLLAEGPGKREAFDNKVSGIKDLGSDSKSGFNAGDKSSAVNSLMQGMNIDTANFQSNLDTQLASYKTFVDQLKQLNDARLISDQDYAAASLKLELNRQQIQISAASSFFGNLAGLQNSHSKTARKIGQAAAIAQTTIATYQSATSAYAAMAGIPIIGPALGIAAAAAAIVAGLANVNAIRSQGYESGGYTGNYGTKDVAGVVHGKEFVINAKATATNRSMLEAINQGARVTAYATGGYAEPDSNVGTFSTQSAPQSNNGPNVKVIVNNNADGTKATTKERNTPNGREIEIIIERVVVKSVNSGGAISSAIETQYGLNRSQGATY